MILRIDLLFATSHAVLMYILAKLRTGEVCPSFERRPLRRFRSKTTLPITVAQKPTGLCDTALQAVLLPCSCGVGILLRQMPSHADLWQPVSAMSRVIMHLPWSSSPWDTWIRQAIFPLQVALALCASPSGGEDDLKQPNSKGRIPGSLIRRCPHLDLGGDAALRIRYFPPSCPVLQPALDLRYSRISWLDLMNNP
ncbi:hypothetical protein PISMIDRAFT_18709 [Pisolithus microcarpus 441]|uniref:Uncharacterized protein n=1 Tax=Pisolithus microcarpus 441 TaxID=765257 RepID=A0A0C9Y6C9_9AGAM|nr:hypothetical protein BKA83DRAFT_18709 [Pisolithus microcarpus]KIK12486.1 hypothetical protein PISMIDRAFT_18709 [Pisolithus microcarpus 441]